LNRRHAAPHCIGQALSMVGGARSAAVVPVLGLLGLFVPALVTPASAASPKLMSASAHPPTSFVVDLASSSTTTTSDAASKARPAKPKTVQVGHSTFWECKAKSTEMLVAVSALTVHVGTPLTINVTVRNTGSTPCNYVAPYAGVAPGPTVSALQAGPCGSVGFQVVGPREHSVWPGPAAFHCPALGFAQLQPGAAVSGSGTWAENKPGRTAHVPLGRYTLVVDGHFRFPIRVTG
jgi:hypothetical protein